MILNKLEADSGARGSRTKNRKQMELFFEQEPEIESEIPVAAQVIRESEVEKLLKNININSLTPVQALNELARLSECLSARSS